MYLIGTDEAGYGPNLGPLVVSTTLWRVPDDVAEDLYPALASAIAPGPVARHDCLCAPIADSKRLYSSGGSWEQLELGLLAALGACGQTFRTWREVWAALSPAQLAMLDQEHWSAAFDMPMSVNAFMTSKIPNSVETAPSGSATRLTWRELVPGWVDCLAMARDPPRDGNARGVRRRDCLG